MDRQQPLISNPAKNKLKAGEPIFGVNIFEALTPSVVKIAAHAGFDVLMVDAEHALNDGSGLAMFLTLVRDNGVAPIVTVTAPERTLVSRVLDAGAMGIILSHSDTPEQMEDLVRWVKYAPEGVRGLALGANAGYDGSDIARYCREANQATLVLPKIESPLGVENAGAMMDVEGVDGVVFGPGRSFGEDGTARSVGAPRSSGRDQQRSRRRHRPRAGRRAAGYAQRQDRIQPRTHSRRTHLRRHQANRIRSVQGCAAEGSSRLSIDAYLRQ